MIRMDPCAQAQGRTKATNHPIFKTLCLAWFVTSWANGKHMNVQLAQRFGLIGVGWCVSKLMQRANITKSRHNSNGSVGRTTTQKCRPKRIRQSLLFTCKYMLCTPESCTWRTGTQGEWSLATTYLCKQRIQARETDRADGMGMPG